MLRVVAGAQNLTLTSLIKVFPGTAQALAMLAAAATETSVQQLPGFVGAAFMASDNDDMLLQFTQWHSVEALAAKRHNYRYADHVGIIRDHGKLHYQGCSLDLVLDQSFSFARGDRVLASGSRTRNVSADTLRADLGLPKSDQIFHIAGEADGRSVAAFSKTSMFPVALAILNEQRWQGEFSVVEAVSRVERPTRRPVWYRLISATPDSHPKASDPLHA